MKKNLSFFTQRSTLMTFGAIAMTSLFILIGQRTTEGNVYISGKVLFEKVKAFWEVENCTGLHLIEFFPLVSSKWTNVTDSDLLLRREKEYMDTLVSNLNHPVVCKVYVFSHQPEYLQKLLLEKYAIVHPNLTIHKSKPNPLYQDMFRFASENLMDRVVAIHNADIQLGKGFDEVDVNWWKEHPKTMHALTRHLPLSGCKIRQISDYCTDKKAKYVGSHDFFLFYMKDQFPETFTKELNFTSLELGSENVIIWAFRNILKFYVTNPCLKPFVHHNHCSGFKGHADHGSRVNVNGKSGLAPYTDIMEAIKKPVVSSRMVVQRKRSSH